jgi:dTMP kinase
MMFMGTSKNSRLCVTRPRQNAHLPDANSAFVAGASLDFEVFRGSLITFEGIEGAGKSLQIARTHKYLQEKGRSCLLTREPGGTGFGLELRGVLLRSDGAAREPWSELLLYLADRHQHLKEVIEPALVRGEIVLCDRYQDATRAYQGAARGIAPEAIEEVSRLLGIIEPAKTILLDLDPETGLRRARQRNSLDPAAAAEGRFEDESVSFHARVRQAYLDLAEAHPQRFYVIPAADDPDVVFARIAALIDQWLKIYG